MKILGLSLIALLVVVGVGLSLPTIVPGCQCGLESGCIGCGGIGNALGSFSLTALALGMMGFVLLIWFGVPVAVVGFIAFGIYKLLTKEKNESATMPAEDPARTKVEDR